MPEGFLLINDYLFRKSSDTGTDPCYCIGIFAFAGARWDIALLLVLSYSVRGRRIVVSLSRRALGTG